MAPKPEAPDASASTPPFEQSLEQLEALVAELESGELPLNEALARFERGVRLTRECQNALSAAQQKVQILLQRGESMVLDDFEAVAGGDAGTDDGLNRKRSMSERSRAYPILGTIETPADLRALPERKLPALAAELREFLIQTVSTRGGHFAAGLGTVELTIALHYVFNTPEDRVVWDVGHQAYPHKVLTGRRERLHTIKQLAGLAPFPTRSESLYDTFGVGHSSTSISAALGMAVAAARQGSGRRAVAVIGDGAMSAGMAFEALNHAGSLPIDLLVVLNDNDMSISENVGALSNYLARVISGPLYAQLRESGKKALRQMPAMRRLARRSEEHVKGMVLPGTLFEEMGFNYVGPIDGHDLKALLRALRTLRTAHGPQLLHLVTHKGKGYAPAEADPITWHGPGPFDPVSGTIRKEKGRHSELFADLRPMAVRHRRARPAHHGHYACHARGLGAHRILATLSRPLF